MTERLSKIANELLPAIGYGDAAGLPVETKHADYIRAEYGEIQQLVPPRENPFYRGEYPAGSTSDDTQLSVVVAESLVGARDFSLQDLAERHVQAYHDTPRVQAPSGRIIVRGWGGSTTNSMERLAAGVEPSESGEQGGSGNGIIMKMAPLAVWQALADVDAPERQDQYDQFTTMTHDSDIARTTTRLHGEVLQVLAKGGASAEMTELVTEYTSAMARDFPDEAAQIQRAVTRPCETFDELVERYAVGKTGFKYGFYVPETLAIAYDIFLGARGDFETSVYRAVNLGGDCDSTASIVAAMATCQSGGTCEVPVDMAKVQDIEALRILSRKLAQTGGEL